MRLLPAQVGYPPNTANGRCYIAGCTNGDAPRAGTDVVVDLETQIDMEGWLIICQDCAEQIAGLLDMTSPSETQRMRGRIRNLEQELQQAETELRAIEGRVVEAVHGA